MLVGGWSYTGSIQRVFINEGFHDRARLANGRPVFDGYLIGVSSQWNGPGYLPLYNDEPFVPVGDARRNLKKSDARVIQFLTESEVELGAGPQAADSDERLGGHRLYELGGVIHVANLADSTLSEREEPAVAQLLWRGYPAKQVPEEPVFSCPIAQSDIPEGAFVRAAVDNLRRWILNGEAPPRAEPLTLNGKKLARDDVGNPKGGIRAAEFEVPLARYGRYEGSDKPSCREDRPYPFVFLLRNELSQKELYRRYQSPEHCLVQGMLNPREGADGRKFGLGFDLRMPTNSKQSWPGWKKGVRRIESKQQAKLSPAHHGRFVLTLLSRVTRVATLTTLTALCALNRRNSH